MCMWWPNNNSAKKIVYSTVNFTDLHFHNMFSTVDKNCGFFVCFDIKPQINKLLSLFWSPDFHCNPLLSLVQSDWLPLYPTVPQCTVLLTSTVINCRILLTSTVIHSRVLLTSTVIHCTILLTSTVIHCTILLTSTVISCTILLTSTVIHCTILMTSTVIHSRVLLTSTVYSYVFVAFIQKF